MRNRELNSVRISNPDGLCKKYREPNRISPKNMRRGAVQEASSRSVRETVRVAELRRRRRVGKPERRRGKKKDIRKAARGASMAGHALLIFTAVVFCAVVYVSSLTIRVRPCSSMATALAFQTTFRNPDETPLRATLYSERESYDKDFVGVAYLLFEGLEKKTKYALSIVNLETEEKIYSSTFLTAEEDPYRIQVEDPIVTEEGLFQFSLAVGGLGDGDFYTVCVMDENGKTISVTDHSETQTTFSIPIKSFAASSEETGTQSGATGQASGGTGTQSGVTGQTSGGSGTQPGATGQQSGGSGTQSGATGETSAETGQAPDATGEQSGETEETSVETEEEAGEASAEAGEEAVETGEASNDAAQEWDMDALPFITVKVNGKTFLPRVWNNEKEPEPVRESAAEAPDAESVVEPLNPDEIEWIWNEERTEVSAFAPDPEDPAETVRLDASFTETVAKEADCTEAGLAVYELSAVDENGVEYKDTQTEVIPPKGHSYERVRLDETQNGTSAEYVCAACGKTYRV
ncbi:MAG: hypothetical protein IJK52_08995, partial [Oscillospiraceae bacterium]|nr:hypothetical protein [Oscillospiraceae bacterium]